MSTLSDLIAVHTFLPSLPVLSCPVSIIWSNPIGSRQSAGTLDSHFLTHELTTAHAARHYTAPRPDSIPLLSVLQDHGLPTLHLWRCSVLEASSPLQPYHLLAFSPDRVNASLCLSLPFSTPFTSALAAVCT